MYTLIEGINSKNIVDSNQLVDNKINLLEFLTKKELNDSKVKKDILSEFSEYSKDVRILTYKVLLEKFNEKHKDLSNEQKTVLKEFINSVDSTPGLRNFYNIKINELKDSLAIEVKNVKDKATKIKINEVVKLLVEISKTEKVTSDNLVDLLQYYELIQEIKVANGKVQV